MKNKTSKIWKKIQSDIFNLNTKKLYAWWSLLIIITWMYVCARTSYASLLILQKNKKPTTKRLYLWSLDSTIYIWVVYDSLFDTREVNYFHFSSPRARSYDRIWAVGRLKVAALYLFEKSIVRSLDCVFITIVFMSCVYVL